MTKKSSKAKQPSAATKREPPFRLACVSCDRDDYDGVYRLPQNLDRNSESPIAG